MREEDEGAAARDIMVEEGYVTRPMACAEKGGGGRTREVEVGDGLPLSLSLRLLNIRFWTLVDWPVGVTCS